MENLPRQLKIKIGALKRIKSEYFGYQKEEEKQREKIKTLELTNSDSYSIKKQKEVLEETVLMIPNVKSRLAEALTDIKSFMDENSEKEALKDSEEKNQAFDLISSIQDFLNEINSL